MMDTAVSQPAEDTRGNALTAVQQSIFFLALILCAVLFSLRVLWAQRHALLEAQAGREASPPDLLPLRWLVGALTLGSLGFFFVLALQARLAAAPDDDPCLLRALDQEVLAALLVLLAALVRLFALNSRQIGAADIED